MTGSVDPTAPGRPQSRSVHPPVGRVATVEAEPRYFGPDGELYACYHAPQAAPRNVGIVFCYPFGQEYLRSHRCFRVLAGHLAKQGYPCLRFDYYGTGDSAGDSSGGNMARWTEDIRCAIDELELWSHVRSVMLVGLRLGASLALRASLGRGDIDGLVLWEPIVKGRDYLDSLTAAHRSWEDRIGLKNPETDDGHVSLLGFPLSSQLLGELEPFDVLTHAAPTDHRVLVIDAGGTADRVALADKLGNGRGGVEYRQLPDAEIGMDPSSIGTTWIPTQTLREVLRWMMERTA